LILAIGAELSGDVAESRLLTSWSLLVDTSKSGEQLVYFTIILLSFIVAKNVFYKDIISMHNTKTIYPQWMIGS
jgi:hypothetical protein